MATKKISELTKVTSVKDTDLLLVQTSEGTRSISKGNLVPSNSVITDADRTTWNSKQTQIKASTVTLYTANWSGSDTFYQTISISGATAKSKIDLQPDSTVLTQLINDGVSALYVSNNNGTFTAYAIGAKPTTNLTIQVTITEVG